MSVKRLCDCCGKEIVKDDFMVLNLLHIRASGGCHLTNPRCHLHPIKSFATAALLSSVNTTR